MAWDEEYSLYPYQQRASDRMIEKNVLLAFDMGCGKTPTTLHAIETLRGTPVLGGMGIIVVPASLKFQWAREIAKFTDQACIVIDGSKSKRTAQFARADKERPGYLVMSYDSFVRDWDEFSPLHPSFLVLDEATAIKNFKSKRSKFFKQHASKFLVRFALTGTPIENGKAEEVFSIMEWVAPNVFGKYWDFEREFIVRNSMGWIESYRNLDRMHACLKPVLLRATHDQPEVSAYLPKVMYLDPALVEMDRATSKAVDWITSDLLADLNDIAASIADFDWENPRPDHPDGKMMAKIQVLRMLLDHPSAVLRSAERFNDPTTSEGSSYAAQIVAEGVLDKVRRSPKMDALWQYVQDFLDADPANKAVVFCSFLPVADCIEKLFTGHAVVFNGSMSSKAKDAAKTRFASDPSCRVFVSTDAGGYGLDLPEANMLINFDLPWQSGLLKQRNARIRRASSSWQYVVVQDFIVEGTIEERMRQMLDHKIAFSDAVVDGTGISAAGTLPSDLDSLRAFLTNN